MTEPCPVCPPERARIPVRPLVCEACRARVKAQLLDLPDLVAELGLRQVEPGVGWRLDEHNRPASQPADPVAAELPAASVPSRRGPRISGSRERPAPLPLDAVDLTARARHGSVHDTWGDQCGQLPVSGVLDLWMLALREHRQYRHRREILPNPNVRALTKWLADRLPDACDSYPGIGELAAEIRDLRAALRAALGLITWDDELKEGVACPHCDSRAALHQANGSDRVECAACGTLLTLDEYERWVQLIARPIRWRRGETCPHCHLERLYHLVVLPGEVRCGWCDLHD